MEIDSMVSETLLLDLSLKVPAGSMKKTGFFLCDCAGTNYRMGAVEV